MWPSKSGFVCSSIIMTQFPFFLNGLYLVELIVGILVPIVVAISLSLFA